MLSANLISQLLDRSAVAYSFRIFLLLTFIACTQKADKREENITNSRRAITLILPEALENRRKEFEDVTVSAMERVKEFARQHNWGKLMEESFMDSVVIFDSKNDFDKTLLKLSGMDTAIQLPKTYSACLENRVLLSVSPELYITNFPEGKEDKYYEKLLAHEIAHRLHIRILNGIEDDMGSVWFYEGFAIYAADQLNDTGNELTPEEMWKIINSTVRGSYKNYGTIIRHFAQKTSIETLVKKAGEKDFTEWLISLEQN